MRWSKVCVEAIGYDLPEERWSTQALESRLSAMYASLGLAPGHVESLTGIRERRVFPKGSLMAERASRAARSALERAGLMGSDLGAVVYAGVCRDNLEPATACAVADAIGARGEAHVFDVSNACLGVLTGIVEVANRIELGQIRSGLVVSAESSREIVESSIRRMNEDPSMARYRLGLATLTGGSGAVAVVLTDSEASFEGRRLVAGAVRCAPEHHGICRWGPSRGLLGETENVMETDATKVLEHGISLAKETWTDLLRATGWRAADVDRVVCHQVGAAHQREVLAALEVGSERDFSTFEHLGNIGTVSLPLTLALASEEGFLRKGDRVALLGIGSGLNCLMIGAEW